LTGRDAGGSNRDLTAAPGRREQEDIIMNFTGTGLRLGPADYDRAAKTIGCNVSAVRAVVTVEAAGAGFDSRNRPKVLPEPHYFHRLLSGAKRDQAVAAGLAYPKWGSKPYDTTQDARYARIDRMMAIDAEAALDSCSWGLGQIMGANAETCGFRNAADMVTAFLEGEGRQLDGVVGFIIGNGLAKHLVNRDWAAFARGYNGPGYAANAYDKKLAAAYAKHAALSPVGTDPLADGYLSKGDVGEPVRALQAALTALGFPTGGTDGAFGTLTDQAVRQYQWAHKLTVDGKVGRITGKALGLAWAT
jgi:hypothetical protein